MVVFVLALAVIGALNWYLVFNEGARRNLLNQNDSFGSEVNKGEMWMMPLARPTL